MKNIILSLLCLLMLIDSSFGQSPAISPDSLAGSIMPAVTGGMYNITIWLSFPQYKTAHLPELSP